MVCSGWPHLLCSGCETGQTHGLFNTIYKQFLQNNYLTNFCICILVVKSTRLQFVICLHVFCGLGHQPSPCTAVWEGRFFRQKNRASWWHSQPDDPLQSEQSVLYENYGWNVSTCPLVSKHFLIFSIRCCHYESHIFPISSLWLQLGGVSGAKLQRSTLHPGEEGLQQLLWLGCSEQHCWLNSPCPLQLN